MRRTVKIVSGKPVNQDVTIYNIIKYEGSGVEKRQYYLSADGEWKEFGDYAVLDAIAVPGIVTARGTPWEHVLFEGEV